MRYAKERAPSLLLSLDEEFADLSLLIHIRNSCFKKLAKKFFVVLAYYSVGLCLPYVSLITADNCNALGLILPTCWKINIGIV